MKKIKFKEGDIFYINDIKLGNKTFSFENKKRIGKLIYISSYFKNMIGFIPSENTFTDFPEKLHEIKFLNYVIYTGNSELKNGNWEVIGHQDITDDEVLLTKRRVGNVMMIKDDEIGICSDDDYKTYQNQGIAGLGAVHYLLMNLP